MCDPCFSSRTASASNVSRISNQALEESERRGTTQLSPFGGASPIDSRRIVLLWKVKSQSNQAANAASRSVASHAAHWIPPRAVLTVLLLLSRPLGVPGDHCNYDSSIPLHVPQAASRRIKNRIMMHLTRERGQPGLKRLFNTKFRLITSDCRFSVITFAIQGGKATGRCVSVVKQKQFGRHSFVS